MSCDSVSLMLIFWPRPSSQSAQRRGLKKAFTQEQAGQVKVFVENLPSGIRTILVHCEGGFSRSCAIVLALNELYGCVVDHGQLSEANPSVLKLMTGR